MSTYGAHHECSLVFSCQSIGCACIHLRVYRAGQKFLHTMLTRLYLAGNPLNVQPHAVDMHVRPLPTLSTRITIQLLLGLLALFGNFYPEAASQWACIANIYYTYRLKRKRTQTFWVILGRNASILGRYWLFKIALNTIVLYAYFTVLNVPIDRMTRPCRQPTTLVPLGATP